ncbi:MAG: peptidylprolyl isomerase [Armatimonadota bacterium]|nr:peptidylprolyl isomerase [Armatimonadota bacterium]
MTTALKRIAIAIALLALPVAWIWTTMERPNFPSPPPATPENPSPGKVKRVAVPGRQVVIETSKGKIVAELYEQDAKITTRNFVGLVQKKFYDGLVFHRVEPGFVIQTGDPTATGSGGSGKTIPLEISPILKHNAPGILGMARSDDPNSATSQFYITLDPVPDLDDRYAVFGKVVAGMDVAARIKVGDKVKRMRLLPPDKPAVRFTGGT